MTPIRRRVQLSKDIAQVNYMGTSIGIKYILYNYIDLKQLLKASKWRRFQSYNIKYS